MKDANRFYRKLYGYLDHSHFGKYKKFRKGFIHQIQGIKIAKSTIILPYKNMNALIEFLTKNNIKPKIINENLYMEEKNFYAWLQKQK
jgi:hypothetical protein